MKRLVLGGAVIFVMFTSWFRPEADVALLGLALVYIPYRIGLGKVLGL